MYLIEIKTENGSTSGYWQMDDKHKASGIVAIGEATHYPDKESAVLVAANILRDLSFFVGLYQLSDQM